MFADSVKRIVCKLKDQKLLSLYFSKTVWWWQFGYSDRWTPECITKLGWDVKVKLIQEAELPKIYFGFFIIWLKETEKLLYWS